MIMRRSLTTVAATALLLGGAATSAWAGDSHDMLPGADTALVQVFVNSEADVDKLSAKYDLAEYKQVEDDGTIQLNIDVDAQERAELKAMGFRIGQTIEDAKTRAAVNAEREHTAAQEALAFDLAKKGVPRGGIKLEGKSVVPTPGETVIQRANKFTNYAGTFLYVEAHNKATVRTAPGANTFTGPGLTVAFAGADGVYTANPTIMPRFIDTDPTPDEYLYHRQLIRLTPEQAAIPASQMTVRVAATSGAVDTFKVTEWLGTTLPPNVAGYQKGFFNRYQDPTENRAKMDALTAEFGNLMTAVNLPNLTNGYQRKSQAIMSGSNAIGAAPDVQLGTPILDQTGEITTAAPVASSTFSPPLNVPMRITTDGIPSGSTDLILTLKDPSGTVLASIDTGTSPEVINRTYTVAGTYTIEISGYQGDIGDFTLKVQPTSGSAAVSAAAAVVLTTKDGATSAATRSPPSSRTRAPTTPR